MGLFGVFVASPDLDPTRFDPVSLPHASLPLHLAVGLLGFGYAFCFVVWCVCVGLAPPWPSLQRGCCRESVNGRSPLCCSFSIVSLHFSRELYCVSMSCLGWLFAVVCFGSGVFCWVGVCRPWTYSALSPRPTLLFQSARDWRMR